MWRVFRDGSQEEVRRLMTTIPIEDMRTIRSEPTDATMPSAPLLVYLLRCGRNSVVRAALARGADPTGRVDGPGDFAGYNLLHFAALQQCSENILSSVAQNPTAAVAMASEKGTADGFTPLHCAARYGRTTAIRMLLQMSKEPIDARATSGGATPLMLACRHSDTAADVDMMLAAGARTDGAVPYATQGRVSDGTPMDANVVLVLLLHGADPSLVAAELLPSCAPSVRCVAEYRTQMLAAELTRVPRIQSLSARQLAAELSIPQEAGAAAKTALGGMGVWAVASSTGALSVVLSPRRMARPSSHVPGGSSESVTVSRLRLCFLMTAAVYVGILIERFRFF